MPFALAPKRKFSPTETLLAPSRFDQDLRDELLGGDLHELLVERDHHQLLDPEPVDDVALHVERHDQLRRRIGVDHAERMRVEGEDGVRVVDHRLVALVDAVEDADRDVPVARLGVGELCHLDGSFENDLGAEILSIHASDCDAAGRRG